MARSATRRVRRFATRSIASALAATVLILAGISYAAAEEIYGQLDHADVFSPLANRPGDGPGMNILLVGSDDRSGLTDKERRQMHVGKGDFGRHTDTIMIVHVATDGSVQVVSIPRDSDVTIPAHTTENGQQVASESSAKINAAYSEGGPTLVVQTIEQNTGIFIDHYAEINFAGFVGMVDGVGGVPVCLPYAMNDKNAGLNLAAGKHTLKGDEALGYVRSRYVDATSDYGRMKRQQAFLLSMFNKATSPAMLANPVGMMLFLNSAGSSITVDAGLDRTALIGLLATAGGSTSSGIEFFTVPTTGSANSVGNEVWDPAKASEMFSKLASGESLAQPKAALSPGTTEKRADDGASVTGGINDVKKDVCK
jgi:LCP family protein required for cell wall assembly